MNRANFYQFDQDFYSHSTSQQDNSIPIWPLVQSSKVRKESPPFSSSNKSISISFSTTEELSAYKASSLPDLLQRLDFKVEIRRDQSDCSIALSVNGKICGNRHGYEMQVEATQIRLVGGDVLGLTFGIDALSQLFSHHNKEVNEDLVVPSMVLSDCPFVQTRAVLWSVDSHLDCHRDQQWLKNEVGRLVRQRFDRVMLLLPLPLSPSENFPGPAVDGGGDFQRWVGVLQGLCEDRGLKVLPTILVDQCCGELAARLQSVMRQLRCFVSSSVTLVFSLHPSDLPPHALSSPTAQCEAAAKVVFQALKRSRDEGVQSGTVYVSGNEWFLDQVPLVECAESQGLTVFPLEYELLLSTSDLGGRPVLSTPQLVSMLRTYFHKVECHSGTMAVLPEVFSDAALPTLVTQFHRFLFSGFSWNGLALEALLEQEGPGVAHLGSLKAPLEAFLLPAGGSTEEGSALVDLLTGKLIQGVSDVTGNGQLSSMFEAERRLWSLITLPHGPRLAALQGHHHHADEGLLSCVRFLSILLDSVHWTKPIRHFCPVYDQEKTKNTSPFPTTEGQRKEVDELLSLLDLMRLLGHTCLLPSQNTVRVSNQSLHSDLDERTLSPTNQQLHSWSRDSLENEKKHDKRGAVYDLVDITKPYKKRFFAKNTTVYEMLLGVVQQNVLFKDFSNQAHREIVDSLELLQIPEHRVVVKQDEPGELFYICESGSLVVLKETKGRDTRIGAKIGPGGFFGELALMYNMPRAATVMSTEPSQLWRIDRQTYRSIVAHHSKETIDEISSLIGNVCILGRKLGDVLSSSELAKLASTVEREEFVSGAVIVRQYHAGDYFYIISEGTVDVFQESEADKFLTPKNARDSTAVRGRKVATLRKGAYFGEKALLADDVRQASCVAVGTAVCFSLCRSDFISLVGRWQDIPLNPEERFSVLSSPERQLSDDTTSSRLSEATFELQQEFDLIRLKKLTEVPKKEFSLDQLTMLSVLGSGAFGKVKLVQDKNTGEQYALKMQSKVHLEKQGMKEMVLNEYRVMNLVSDEGIVQLFGTFQDKKYIYFLLELLPGGEFFNFLQTVGKLPEKTARFYGASVVSAFSSIHRLNIAYRDLKPENMVMDRRGYVKLVDFGLAKKIEGDCTWTMCGTPDYLAPEIVLSKGHTHAVDYWALGVLLFELVFGWPPFYHENPMKVYEKVIKAKFTLPEDFSPTLADLTQRLLTKNPAKRLGVLRGGITDIFRHRWFGSFDWTGLIRGTLSAPHVPRCEQVKASDALDEEDDPVEESEWVADFS